MNHKIGEVITLPNGLKGIVVETYHNNCESCIFNEWNICILHKYCGDVYNCDKNFRNDHKDVKYKIIK